tara:strand:- start:2096 stop:3118 length:1023 start_codon:yes stop_codon:yes gene_type:complete
MLSAILSLAAPAILGPAGLSLVANPMVASAIGGGLGSLLQGGDTQDVLTGAALGGIGSAIGGSSAFGANPTQGTLTSAPGITPALNPDIAAKMGGAAAGVGTGLTTPTFTQALTRPEAIGAGLGGLAADSMIMPKYRKEEEEKEYPRGMPIKNTSVFPEFGYDAGKMGEFNYRIPRNFAEGGEVEAMDAGIGGMMKDGMNDKELISSAIDVIQGEIDDPDKQQVILGQFVAQFGQDALQDLITRVQSGDIPAQSQEGDGMVKGAGDGMADMIPASMEGDQDVLLSDGEFVVPADVVSGLGNGSSDAGANKLEDMMDRVRELRTGGKEQPPAIPDEMMLPA